MLIYTRLIILFLLVALIPLGVIGLTSYYHATDIIESTGHEFVEGLAGLEVIAELKGQAIESFFGRLVVDLRVAQYSYTLRTQFSRMNEYHMNRTASEYSRAKMALDSELRAFRKTRGFIDIILLNNSGEIIYTTEEAHSEKELGEPFMVTIPALETKENLFFSEIFESPFAQSGFEIVIAGPITNLNGSIVGVVIYAIDLSPVYELVEDHTGLGKTGETLIGRNDGDSALFLNPLRHDPNAALYRTVSYADENALPIRESTQGNSGSGVTTDYRGEPILAAWRPLNLPGNKLEWGLVTKIDEREVLSPLYAFRKLFIIISIITIIVVGFLAFFMANSITRPIRNLKKTIDEISKGNLASEVDDRLKKSGDEVGDLTRSLLRIITSMRLAIDKTRKLGPDSSKKPTEKK